MNANTQNYTRQSRFPINSLSRGVYANLPLPIHLNTAYDVRATDTHSIVPPKAAHLFPSFFLPTFTLLPIFFFLFGLFVVLFLFFLDPRIFNRRRNAALF